MEDWERLLFVFLNYTKCYGDVDMNNKGILPF